MSHTYQEAGVGSGAKRVVEDVHCIVCGATSRRCPAADDPRVAKGPDTVMLCVCVRGACVCVGGGGVCVYNTVCCRTALAAKLTTAHI